MISSIFRGLGDSKKSDVFHRSCMCGEYYTGLSVYRIFSIWELPVGALGTTLSQACSVLFALIAIKRKQTGLSLSGDCFRPQKKPLGKILNIGIPVALQDGFIQIAFIVITIIANRRGLNAAAAVGIVEKIISFLFLVPSSMLSTVSALAAQNIGAGKYDRAKQTLRYAMMIAIGFGLVVSILIQFIAAPVVGLFTADAAVILLGAQYIRGYIWDCIFAGVHFSFSGYFCACGKSGISFLHNLIAILCVRIPGVYLTSKNFPAYTVSNGTRNRYRLLIVCDHLHHCLPMVM